MSVYEQIAELQRQRDQINADFERQLVALRAQGSAELEAARKQVAALESVMGERHPSLAHRELLAASVAAKAGAAPVLRNPIDPISETDFGQGIGGGGNGNQTFEEFQDELAAMRDRNESRGRMRRA